MVFLFVSEVTDIETIHNVLSIARSKTLDAARHRVSPSAGAKNSTLVATQTTKKPEAILNGRPFSLTGPPVSIYHPVFAHFVKRMKAPMDTFQFTPAELKSTRDFVVDSLNYYPTQSRRVAKLGGPTTRLDLDILRFMGTQTEFRPDGMILAECRKLDPREIHYGPVAITEVENGVGEGECDPTELAQAGYVAFVAHDEVSV